MSAEISTPSTQIELYVNQPPYLRILPLVETPEEIPALAPDDTITEFSLYPEVSETTVQIITKSADECVPDCPIIKHGLSEIMSETDQTVIKSLTELIKNIHKECKVGPQKSNKPRFFVVGPEIEEITCGSALSKHHPKQRTSRTTIK